MPENNKIRNFTAADIEKYHRGLLSPKERHELEKAALDDPFLADALEGYEVAGLNITEDIAELNKRLLEKTTSSKVIPLEAKENSSFSWWRVAAVAILIAGAGFLVYQFAFNKKPKEIAEIKPVEKKEVTPPDSFQTGIVQKSEVKPEIKENKVETKNKTRVSATNETMGSGMSRTKADTAITQSLNAQPLRISPSKDLVAKQNFETEELSKDATAKKEMNAQVFKDKNSLSETVVAKNIDDAKERFDANKKEAFNKLTSSNNNSLALSPHDNIFKGRITDANNNPLPFANITNTKDSIGTYADAKGYFTLTSTDSVLDVRIQSLGFTNKITRLRSDAPKNNVMLQEDDNLEAVVLSKKKPNTNLFAASNQKLQESEPADGWENYDTYLANNLKVPETIRMKQSGGDVEVSFDVDKNGEPINIKIEKSLCTECDKEAMRLIKDGPKWIRHKKNGRAKIIVSF